jgi:hypothetical protein
MAVREAGSFAVPWKSGGAGGGRRPQFKTERTKEAATDIFLPKATATSRIHRAS